MIHTNPTQGDFREKIRQTWGDTRLFGLLGLRLAFFMGRVNDSVLEQQIMVESHKYGDVIVTNFEDYYKNLVFKALSWMKYVNECCVGNPFIVKTDDDILVDPFKVIKGSLRI